MSWIREGNLNFVKRSVINVMKMGDVPKHIALIMDGNRRFAQKNNVQKAVGHSKGFDKLSETLEWCLNLGVKEVTVYAFSIENFKRSKDEVDCLMDLAIEKFQKLIEEEEKLNREGVNIKVIGNTSLLPMDLQKLIARAVHMTKQNFRARLNVAFSYTSRDEITEATRRIAEGVAAEEIEEDDITPELIEGAMYSSGSLPLDLLIRTSGEVRLSDFLLWQASHCVIHFTPVLWPDFSFWDFMKAVFHYQRTKPLLPQPQEYALSQAASKFLSNLQNSRFTAQTALLQSS